MALEAVVFQQDLFCQTTKDLYHLFGGGSWSGSFDSDLSSHFGGLLNNPLQEEEEEEEEEEEASSHFLENQTESCHHHHYGTFWNSLPPPPQPSMPPELEQWCPNSSLEPDTTTSGPVIPPQQFPQLGTSTSSTTSRTRPKRRRSRSRKNLEEIENQRRTHIAVERNRRKQMNEYLSVLRNLMPESYVPRTDQASIIGGAINYVKELEQHLQLLGGHDDTANSSPPFGDFFTFPQYRANPIGGESSGPASDLIMAENQSGGIADIEVTMVESHANLKIRTKRRPKQLLKMVSGLQSFRLTVLHLNVTTVDQLVLYSLSLKVEDDCKLTSGDEIATAVNQLLGRIQEEAIFC